MKHQAPFVVKRLAPMIGRPEGARRIAVAYFANTLPEALDAAQAPALRRRALEGMRAKEGGGGAPWLTSKILELERTATWIERRDASAILARKRTGGGGGGA